jgi:hypothetical protein
MTLQAYAGPLDDTYRFIEFSIHFELFFSELGQVNDGRELKPEAFGRWGMQVTPGKVGQTGRNHAFTEGPKELDFTKVLVQGSVRHCFCRRLHGRSRLKVLFGETGTDIELTYRSKNEYVR